MRQNRDEFFVEEVRRALIADERFDFHRSGDTLQNGVCPQCGERRCFVSLKKPFQVMCNRRDSCGYAESTRKIYSHLFDDLAVRFPRTEINQNAPADAYMQYNRGFDLSKIRGMYEYYGLRLEGKERPVVRVKIDNGSYWHRFIHGSDARYFGKNRNTYGEKIEGSGWSPPGMKVNKGDEIWITEAIFKSMAFLHIGKKAITGLSTSGYYRDFVRKHKGKKIRWVMAMDNGSAGIEAAQKFMPEILAMGETVVAAFPVFGEDWDDVYRAGRLTDQYLLDSFWRGRDLLSDTIMEKAFWQWARFQRTYEIYNFKYKMYRVKTDYSTFKIEEETEETKKSKQTEKRWVFPDPESGWNWPEEREKEAFNKFAEMTETTILCDYSVEHVYAEEEAFNKKNGNVINFFHVTGLDPRHNKMVSSDGSVWGSVKNFNACISQHGFAVFRGSEFDLDYLRRRWSSRHIIRVERIGFIGYTREFDTYIFEKFAYRKGVQIKMNTHDFVDIGKHALKCSLNNPLNMTDKPLPFNGEWIVPYKRYLGMNGLVILSWWTGTLFAEQIRAKCSHWPFLEVTGAPGTGKSTAVKFLWKCLGLGGDKEQGFDPNKTSLAGLAREMAKFANWPSVLMESDRGQDDRKGKKQFDINYFKPQFEGGVLRTVGIAGGRNDTEVLTFRGGLMIMQNQPILTDEPGYQRIVWCSYEERGGFSRESINAVDALNDMTAKELGGFLHAVLSKEEILLSGFFRIYEEIYQTYTARDEAEGLCPSLRIRRTHAQVAAWARLLPEIFGSEYFSEVDAERVVEELWKRAKTQYARGKAEAPMMDRFWDSFEFLQTLFDEVGATHVPVQLNHAKNEKLIAFKLPEVLKAAADHRVPLPNPDELIANFRESKAFRCQGIKVVRSVLTGKPEKCWVFERS